MEILTYNVQYGKKLEKAIQWISKLKPMPDIFCMQEFPEEKVKVVKKFFKNYGFSFAKAITHKQKVYGELTAHKKDSLKQTDATPLGLGMNRVERKVCRLKGERSALLTTFKLGNKKITISNIHLTMLGQHSIRIKQLSKVLNNLVNAEATIIIGDYNYSNLTWNRGLKKFMKKNNFLLAGKMSTHHLFKIPQQLDYVFYKNCDVENLRVEKVKFSDHLPVLFSINEI